ncbi:MAG: hypothetical protein PWP61_687 [Trichococcus sp.]|nr:hypothetical protein [Trichococcus sp.]
MDTQKILLRYLTLLLLVTMTVNTGLTTVHAVTDIADSDVIIQPTENESTTAESSDLIEMDSSQESTETTETTETTGEAQEAPEEQPNSNTETDTAPETTESSIEEEESSIEEITENRDFDSIEAASSDGVYDREALAEQAMQMMANDLAQKEGTSELSRSLTVSPTSTFINKIASSAVTTWTTHHILPSITIAQAALESAWGTSKLALEANNLYGIKASPDWLGEVYAINTAEYGDEGWHTVTANFRKYASWLDSTNDHGAFFTSTEWRKENYKNVVGETDYKKASQALRAAGYATDPGYPAKLISIIENYNLSRFDPVPNITMRTYIENDGWTGLRMGGDYIGKTSGTIGEGKNINSFSLSIDNENVADEKGLGIQYAAYIEDLGWTNYVSGDTNLGNTSQNKRMEAIKIRLTGNNISNYTIHYRVQVANLGWTGWAKNGEPTGTEGVQYGIEAIEVLLLPQSAMAPSSSTIAFQSLFEMKAIQLTYAAYSQNLGWQASVGEKQAAGQTSLRLEAFKINMSNGKYANQLQYQSYVQNSGWQAWQMSGSTSGTTNQAKNIEAIKVQLSGLMAQYFDVYYRVYVQGMGWLDWARNGQASGTSGMNARIGALQVSLVEKGSVSPGLTNQPYIEVPPISYTTFNQKSGWQAAVSHGTTSGATVDSNQVEALQLKVPNLNLSGTIQYRAHVQDNGWLAWASSGETAGFTDRGKRIEAIEIKLTEELAAKYDVYYRVYTNKFGWLNWAKNGVSAGTAGLADPIKAIEIKILQKGSAGPGTTAMSFIDKSNYVGVLYQTHVQNIGWQGAVSDGMLSGTTGMSYRLEGIKINLQNSAYSGSISYRTHVETYGWQNYVSNNAISGTMGEAKRLEAIEINLIGEISEKYDVYYRVHAQDFGWLGWTKNGGKAGTAGLAKRLESIQIKMVPKGLDAPGSTVGAFKTK